MWHLVMMNMTRYDYRHTPYLSMIPFCYDFNQPQYGHLKACIQMTEGPGEYCIVQYFHQMESNNQPLLDDKDCPILLLSDIFMCIPSDRILTPVSIVHECDAKCTLQMRRKRVQTERQQCEVNSLVLIHDYSNDMFVVNIYCIKNVN